MKKKIIISMLVIVALMCLMAISISATEINKDSTVTLNGSFTTEKGSVTNPVVSLYDAEGYALVWYLNTDNKLVSDRAVNLITVTDKKAKFSDVSKFYGNTQQKSVIVVNLRDNFVSDGITEIETFDSNFQFGYYGAKKNPPIQYFYFPVTATEIIDRMFQETQLIIADIEPGTPISRMGVHAVAQSNLKEFFVPNDITAFIEHDDVGIFQDTKLEKITFEEGSQIKVIPYRCFYMCNNLKELILPNSVEEIHYRALQFTLFDSNAKLEKLVLGANFKGFKGTSGDNFYVRGAKNVNVYLPATFNADNVDVNSAHQYFTNCANATFYYCGTEAEWDRLIAKISLGKNGATGNDSGENIITAKANGKVVFNNNACDTFYNGVHSYKASACVETCSVCNNTKALDNPSHTIKMEISYTKYTVNGTKHVYCTNEGCTMDETLVAPKLFEFLGYSTNKENTELCVGYSFNEVAIAEYNEANGKNIQLGVAAAIINEGESLSLSYNDGTVSSNLNNTVIAPVNNTYVGVDFKLTGFKDFEEGDTVDLKALNLVMCAYAYDGEFYFIGSADAKDYCEKSASTVTFATIENKVAE
ncbi:MAG: leucine-rich repeat protein [Clostridia bacterium]|nr:leucine-rich repeat protein [Clostridia bacterium]